MSEVLEPVDAGDRGERPPDDPFPHRGVLGAPQGIGLASRQDRRHPGPEELGRKRRHEGRDADLGDDHAVDEADENSGGQACDDRDPAEVVFLEEDGENEAGKRDDRGKTEIDLTRADHEGQSHRKQNQRRQGREKSRIDIGR